MYTYIILDYGVMISKTEYKSWKDIQDQYYSSYKTSMTFDSIEELIVYFTDEHTWLYTMGKRLHCLSY